MGCSLPAHRPWDRKIVLVADPVDPHAPKDAFDRRIDRPSKDTVDELRTALDMCCGEVIVLSDLTTFTAEVSRYSQSLVFPYWFGQISRSRHGLLPAICEANDLMFVGADAFVKVVCNDKELSKAVCRQVGLDTPASILLQTIEELEHLRGVSLPVVVKPNYEGTSLGITQRNLCRSWQEVSQVAEIILRQLGQPVIVEEFISGREFSACLLGNGAGVVELQIGSWKIEGKSDYLDHQINSFEFKLPNDLEFELEMVTSQFDEAVIEAMRRCFRSLGKVELLRIDGRQNETGVFIIELTPDIYLGSDGEYCQALKKPTAAYSDMIRSIIANSLEGYQAQVPMS